MRTTTRRTARAAALLAVSALTIGALSACTPDEPTPEPSTAQHTSTPTPTPTPTPTVAMPAPVPSPTRPVEWLDDGEAGAEESARYFVALYAYTVSSQDTSAWEAMSDPGCKFCASVVENVEADVAAQRVTFAAPMRITSSSVIRQDEDFVVTLGLVTGPDEVRSTTGELLETQDERSGTSLFSVTRRGENWVVLGVSTGANG